MFNFFAFDTEVSLLCEKSTELSYKNWILFQNDKFFLSNVVKDLKHPSILNLDWNKLFFSFFRAKIIPF